ncbi:hypothetical protein TYRP_007504, partial [Tyrophagus putrescentiae]
MNPSKDNLSSSKYDSWLHSKMSTFDVNHIWKIDKFKELSSNYKELSSSVFSAHDIELRVCMQVLNERELISDKSIDMCLECFPGKSVTGDISVDYRISILKNDGDVGIFKKFSKTFSKGDKRQFVNFALYSSITNPSNNYLIDKHQLNVCLKAKVFYNRLSLHSFTGTYNHSEMAFSSNQKALFESGKHSDVTIVVGKTKIPAHKSILCAHSPVFDAMFSNKNTIEAQTSVVNISDVSADVMKDFLLFIYSGIKPKSDRLTVYLLEAANKYQVLDLKIMCENHLISILCIKNVVDFFYLADMYNASNLKENCLKFISCNFDKVMLTDDWAKLGRFRYSLMVEATKAIALKNKQSAKVSQ